MARRWKLSAAAQSASSREILTFRQIDPAIKMNYFKEILSFNSLNLRLAGIKICFQKYFTQRAARAYKKKKNAAVGARLHTPGKGPEALLAPNSNFEKSFRRHPLELQNAPYTEIFVSLSSFYHKNFRIFRVRLVFLISLTPTLLHSVSRILV